MKWTGYKSHISIKWELQEHYAYSVETLTHLGSASGLITMYFSVVDQY